MLLERLPNERNYLVIDKSRDRLLYHAFVFSQFGANIEKIQWIEFRASSVQKGIPMRLYRTDSNQAGPIIMNCRSWRTGRMPV